MVHSLCYASVSVIGRMYVLKRTLVYYSKQNLFFCENSKQNLNAPISVVLILHEVLTIILHKFHSYHKHETGQGTILHFVTHMYKLLIHRSFSPLKIVQLTVAVHHWSWCKGNERVTSPHRNSMHASFISDGSSVGDTPSQVSLRVVSSRNLKWLVPWQSN